MHSTYTCLHEKTHTVKQIQNLTNDTYILRFDKGNIHFKAGQYIKIGLENSDEFREYSIYSAEQDNYLEILIKELPDGYLSSILKHLKPEDTILVKETKGSMVLKQNEIYSKRYMFIASGTGIAPFHSFIKTHPGIDYTILHGVQHTNEAYGKDDYELHRYKLCTSRDENGDFFGRVTDYLQNAQLDPGTIYYVCGNSLMIKEVYNILVDKGISLENVRSEVYY